MLFKFRRHLCKGSMEGQIRFDNFLIKPVITNRVTNIRLHSLSQIFKVGTEVRVDVPAPHHNVIPENKQFYQ